MDDDMASHFSDISIKHETSLDLTTLTTVNDEITTSPHDEIIEIQSTVSVDNDQKPFLPYFIANEEIQPSRIEIVEKQPKKEESPPVHRNTGKLYSIANYRRRRLLSTCTRPPNHFVRNETSNPVAPSQLAATQVNAAPASQESCTTTIEQNPENSNILVSTFTQSLSNSDEVIQISDDEITGEIIDAPTQQHAHNQVGESQVVQVQQPNHNAIPTSIAQSAQPPMAEKLQHALQLTPAQNHQQAVQRAVQGPSTQSLPQKSVVRIPAQRLAVLPTNVDTFCFICTKQLKNRKTFTSHQRSLTHVNNLHQHWRRNHGLQNNSSQANVQ